MTGEADKIWVPRTEDEVREILRQASRERIPVTISGAGTGVTGGRVAQGGWVLSLEKFTRIEIAEGRARVGAGVTLVALGAEAAKSGQFYAPDPTERTASIGGNIATNASGSRSFRYGSTRRHLLGLRVVLMDGSIHEYRRGEPIDFDVPAIPLPRTTKHSAGYPLQPGMDWVDLFCGSEGTLGIVTEAVVRLLPMPKSLIAGIVFFPEGHPAENAVDEWRTIEGLRMIEYIDGNSLDIMRPSWPDIPARAREALLIEHESDDIDPWIERLEAAGAMLEESWFATSAEDRERFRRFRHALPELVNAIVRQRGFKKISSDFAVPVAKSAELLTIYRCRLAELFPGQHTLFGHIGDAHVHINVLPVSEEQSRQAGELMAELARQAVELGGTVAAEHGLGKRRTRFLAIQYAPEYIGAMKAVKRRLDPEWLLGRGTLFAYE